jgi:ferrous iron transport protein B
MAQKQGCDIDVDLLSRCLGVPVAKVDGRRILDQGQDGLREIRKVCHALSCFSMDESARPELRLEYGEYPSDHIEDRDRWAKKVVDLCVNTTDKVVKKTMGELNSIDQWLLHPWFGPFFLVLSMTFMFQMVYVVSAPFMDWMESFIQMLSSFTTGAMNEGSLKSLLQDGIFGGVGGVLVFVPQIAILFFCISLMEESGYLARATFLLDRLLSSVGLHGKSFVPLLSSHACAIPGIMATRSMAHSRDRLATMLVAPYMSCGARLPVYALLIGAFMKGFGPWIQGLALMSCYLLGIGVAFLTSWIMKKSILKMKATDFVLEMPAYQCPRIKSVFLVVWEQVMAFVKKAGTIILGFSILLWGALTFPRLSSQDFNHFLNEQGVQREWYEANKALDGHSVEITDLDSRWSMIKLEHSFAGRMGKGLEDVIAPLGYDWKIGVGLIGAFAAREVFVSTLAIVYSMGNVDDDMDGLHEVMLNEVGVNGQVLWSMPRVMSLLVFFVIAMQCISTMAVMKKETGSWKWPLFQWFMMNGLAYGMAWLIFNLGSALG